MLKKEKCLKQVDLAEWAVIVRYPDQEEAHLLLEHLQEVDLVGKLRIWIMIVTLIRIIHKWIQGQMAVVQIMQTAMVMVYLM